MKENLTTGQMIHTLQIGEVAVNDKGVCITRLSDGFRWCEKDGTYYSDALVTISEKILHHKWTIL